MIHFISGKPRAGKSLYAVKLIVEELVNGTRPVITNLPLNLPVLNEYLQKKWPDKSINLFERVRILTEAETKEFWVHRPGCRINRPTKEEWASGKFPDYTGVVDQGIFWVIDELHVSFGARQWMETGRDCMFYLSQHGHLGDTFIGVTQAIGNVDKQFRSVTQDFTYIRNFSKEKYGVFRMPPVFMRRTYVEPPTSNSVAMETGTFRLDVSGLASCYSTVAGVGIHDRGGADKSERRKGLPWWVAIGCAVLIAWLMFGWAPGFVARWFNLVGRAEAKAGSVVSSVARASPFAGGLGAAAAVALPSPVQPPILSTNKVVGFAQFGGHGFFCFGDGKFVRDDDPDVKAWSRHYVVYAKQVYRLP